MEIMETNLDLPLLCSYKSDHASLCFNVLFKRLRSKGWDTAVGNCTLIVVRR